MSNDNKDPETQAQLSRAESLAYMFDTPGWKYAEQDMMELVAELKDISTIDLEKDAAQQIRDRKLLAESLIEWLNSLKSQVNNAIIISDQEEDTLITRR